MKVNIPHRVDLISAITERDGWACFYPDCEKPFTDLNPPTIDHWMPQSWCIEQGWTPEEIWDVSNLRLMHKSCNAKKGHIIPLDDATLPHREVKIKIPKAQRPDLCTLCESGRLLFVGESCPDCGSGPQPAAAPKALQVSPKDCDHDNFHCWMCFIGHVPRKSSLTRILEGP